MHSSNRFGQSLGLRASDFIRTWVVRHSSLLGNNFRLLKNQLWIPILLLAGPIKAEIERDFSAEFERLYELGLPDVSNAEYIRFTMASNELLWHGRLSFPDRFLSGNAWLLGPTEWGEGFYVYIAGRIVFVNPPYGPRPRNTPRKPVWRESKLAGPGSGGRAVSVDGRIQGANLSKDLHTIVLSLRRPCLGFGCHIGHFVLGTVEDVAAAFVLAALAHRHGLRQEASLLAEALFDAAIRPEQVLGDAVQYIAEGRYMALYDLWLGTRCWRSYRDGLTELIDRFEGIWQYDGGAERLLSHITERVEMQDPPLIDGLSEEEQGLAAALVNADSPPATWLAGLWILPSIVTSGDSPQLPADESGQDPVEAILSRGVASIPLLVRLLDDTFLTYLDHHPSDSRFFRYLSYMPTLPPDTEEDKGWRSYDSMRRPAARGDLARLLLRELLLPRREERDTGQNPDQLRAEAMAWLDRIRTLSLEEVSRIYVQQGTPAQRAAAGIYLMETGGQSDAEFVEAAIRSSMHPFELVSLVEAYLRVEGHENHELLARYEERLRAALEDPNDYTSGQRSTAQRLHRDLDGLQRANLVEEESP